MAGAGPDGSRGGVKSQRRIDIDRAFREHRRRLIEEARENGVSYETRGERVFVVLHLPEQVEPPRLGS